MEDGNVETLSLDDPRFVRLTTEIIQKIDDELPDTTLLVSVIGMLEMIKQHYVFRGMDD